MQTMVLVGPWDLHLEVPLEDARYHDLRRRKEQIVTYVSTSGLQKQSNLHDKTILTRTFLLEQ